LSLEVPVNMPHFVRQADARGAPLLRNVPHGRLCPHERTDLALAQQRSHRPATVFADRRVPGRGAHEIARRLNRWVPVIVTVLVVAGHACKSPPAAPGTGGTDGAPLDAALQPPSGTPGSKSLVVARDGAVVREAFFNGGVRTRDEYVLVGHQEHARADVALRSDRAASGRSTRPNRANCCGRTTVADRRGRRHASAPADHEQWLDFPEMASYGTGSEPLPGRGSPRPTRWRGCSPAP